METIRIRKLNHANLHIDCEYGPAEELKEFFSFFVPGYQFMPAFKRRVWDGKIRLFDTRTGELPAGLIYHLMKFIDSRGYKFELIETPYGMPYSEDKPNAKEFLNFVESLGLPFKIREYQFMACMEGLKRKRAILLSPTGSGKSLIIYVLMRWFIKQHKRKVLIIVPTTSLVEQMSNDFKQYGLDEEFVHKIYSGKDKATEKPIVVSTWQSIYKLPKIWYEQELWMGLKLMNSYCKAFLVKCLRSLQRRLYKMMRLWHHLTSNGSFLIMISKPGKPSVRKRIRRKLNGSWKMTDETDS